MRKIFFLISIIGVVAFAVSCKKEEGVNPLADSNNLGKGAYITLAEAGNLNLAAGSATSTVSIKVTQYTNGDDVDKIKVYAVKGSNSDPAAWKLVKTVTYTGDATLLSVTGQELATALGTTPASIAGGDQYTFYNQVITKGGETYDISNTYSLVEGNSNYNMAFRWTALVVCPFTGAAGQYTVIQDDWVDWTPGDIVTVSDGPGPNQVDISAVWPQPNFGNIVNPLIVNVDPATGAATIPAGITWGDYGGGYLTITLAGSSGYVLSCSGLITLSVHFSGGGADQGFLKLILKK